MFQNYKKSLAVEKCVQYNLCAEEYSAITRRRVPIKMRVYAHSGLYTEYGRIPPQWRVCPHMGSIPPSMGVYPPYWAIHRVWEYTPHLGGVSRIPTWGHSPQMERYIPYEDFRKPERSNPQREGVKPFLESRFASGFGNVDVLRLPHVSAHPENSENGHPPRCLCAEHVHFGQDWGLQTPHLWPFPKMIRLKEASQKGAT